MAMCGTLSACEIKQCEMMQECGALSTVQARHPHAPVVVLFGRLAKS